MARVIFTLVVAALVFTATAKADCSYHNTCYGCTNSDSGDCGWDYQSNSCVRGDAATGYPEGYDYNPSWWAWKTDRCCDQHTSCTGCTQVSQTSCAWSPNNGYGSQCQYANNDDGTTSNTIQNEWQCPSQQNCNYNWDCTSCLNQGGCGWSHDSQQCHAGTSAGPYNGYSYSWHFYTCPNNAWTLRWSVNSVSLWLLLGAVFGCCFCIGACCAGRRRRRILREQNRQAGMIGGNTTAAASAPLMGQPVYQQPPPAIYGHGAAYTSQPMAGSGYGTAAGPVNAVAPFPSSSCAATLYGPADDTPQIEDCSKP